MRLCAASLLSLLFVLGTPSAFAAPGDLDRGFSRDGRATVSVPGRALALDAPGELALAEDGRAVLATNLRPAPRGIGSDPLVAVFKANGSPDPSFSGDGHVIRHLRGIQLDIDAALQPDGGVLIVTTSISAPGSLIVRLQPNGHLDRSFGNEGRFRLRSIRVNDLAMTVGGKILVAGETPLENGYPDFAVMRVGKSGFPDRDFGVDGLAAVDFTRDAAYPSYDIARAVAVGPGGRIVLCGRSSRFEPTESATSTGVALAALRGDGSLDPTFGEGGRALAGPDPDIGDRSRESVAVNSAGAVVFGGTVHDDFTASMYTRFGHPDPFFGGGGAVVVDGGGVDSSDAVAAAPDGGVYMAGSVNGPEVADFAVMHLTRDGAPDPAFGHGGIAAVDFDGRYDDADAVVVRPDGRLLVSGTVGHDRVGLIQLHAR